MKHFFAAILFAAFVAALPNSSVKPTKSTDSDAKKLAQGIMNFYAGSNCKNMGQHLADIKTEIKALKGNQTCGSERKGLCSEVKQQLVDMKEEIRGLRQNLTGGPAGNGLFSEVTQQLAEIKQEIRALKGNRKGGCGGKGLLLNSTLLLI